MNGHGTCSEQVRAYSGQVNIVVAVTQYSVNKTWLRQDFVTQDSVNKTWLRQDFVTQDSVNKTWLRQDFVNARGFTPLDHSRCRKLRVRCIRRISSFVTLVSQAAVTLLLFCTAGCHNYYYDTVSMLGTDKWDVFQERVIAVRNSAAETRDQFAITGQIIEAFPQLQEGQLELGVQALAAAVAQCTERAARLRKRIEGAANTTDLLFQAWEQDIQRHSNTALRDIAAKKLNEVRTAYYPFIVAQRAPLEDIDKVLTPLNEQVAFLSRYLSPDVLKATRGQHGVIAADIRKLVPTLAESVRQADLFIEVILKQ